MMSVKKRDIMEKTTAGHPLPGMSTIEKKRLFLRTAGKSGSVSRNVSKRGISLKIKYKFYVNLTEGQEGGGLTDSAPGGKA